MTTSVLIVDDEFGLAEMLGVLLRLRGFDDVQIAINGQAGLELVKGQQFTLIITDVMMPIMDGIQMIRRIRALPAGAKMPIVVMTAIPSGLTQEERALAQGLLKKPFGDRELIAVLDRVLDARAT